MITALREWLRAYNLRKLEAEAEYYAVAYQAARARLMSAQVRDDNKDTD